MHCKSLCLLVSLCFLLACSTKPKDPVEGQLIKPIQVERFDEAFFALDTHQISIGIASLYKKYPQFSSDFFTKILKVDPIKDTQKIILFYRQYLPVFNDTKARNAPKRINNDLNNALARFHFYFPQYEMPTKLVYYLSPFSSFFNVLSDRYLGVGLQITIYKHYIPEQIPFDCVQNLLDDYLSKNITEKTVLYQMIESGKRQYILNTISLNTPDSLLWNYSSVELKAVKEQEAEIWQYLKEQHMLMSNDRIDLLNMLGEASHNSVLGAPLPGNIGKYIGYRIVQAYMKKQSSSPFEDLKKLATTPASIIYAEANYQP